MNFYPNIPNMMPFNNMNNPFDYNIDSIFNKINELENRIRKLEQKIARLENNKNNNNYLDNDNSHYML